MTSITDSELLPGNDCPICDRSIVTWWAENTPSAGDIDDDGKCGIPADDVEPTGLTTGFVGNTIVIDHTGPSMDGQ